MAGTLRLGGRTFAPSELVVMAIVNRTPDSFFDRGATFEADSALRDFPSAKVRQVVSIKPGSWFDAKAVEDAVTNLNEEAGNLGYAFADINPAYDRDAEKRLMNITFKVGETPLGYLRKLRLGIATMLLHDTDEPLAQIARSVGYTSEFAFNRAFQRARGMPPGRYRRSRA